MGSDITFLRAEARKRAVVSIDNQRVGIALFEDLAVVGKSHCHLIDFKTIAPKLARSWRNPMSTRVVRKVERFRRGRAADARGRRRTDVALEPRPDAGLYPVGLAGHSPRIS